MASDVEKKSGWDDSKLRCQLQKKGSRAMNTGKKMPAGQVSPLHPARSRTLPWGSLIHGVGARLGDFQISNRRKGEVVQAAGKEPSRSLGHVPQQLVISAGLESSC